MKEWVDMYEEKVKELNKIDLSPVLNKFNKFTNIYDVIDMVMDKYPETEALFDDFSYDDMADYLNTKYGVLVTESREILLKWNGK